MGVFFRPMGLLALACGLSLAVPGALAQDVKPYEPTLDGPLEDEAFGEAVPADEPAETVPEEEGAIAEPEPEPEAVAEPEPEPEHKPKWVSPFHTKAWPGTFMAVRLSFGAGSATVPRYGVEEELLERVDLAQLAPYAGIELGATSRRWGGSVSFSGTMIGSAPAHLASAPTHLVLAVNGYHAPRDSKYRWLFGLRPFTQYSMTSLTGQFLHVRGFGFQVGAHRLFSKGDSTAIEGFAILSFDRYTSVAAGFGGSQKDYPVEDFVGSRNLSSLLMLEVGIQFGFLR